ncbi:tail fiber domain-containing protein [Maribellus maritimus]|uniref:tail fiber domain-containing protein n=1 Tax=Maribellus maritimus TaxID=2870838 RepID=UPI001EEC042C|nr:tail fiber domain-containing protein [Maribellus maritimus]MCG6191547.1 tail fiber domain-containing protein [Maribellus maritimus]
MINNSNQGLGAWDSDNGVYRMIIAPNGNVGIGTASPDYPLEVSGSSSGDACDYAYYSIKGDGSVYYGSTTSTSQNYSIVTSSRIKAYSFHAVSDRRIKNNVQHSNGKNELALINKIEVVDYQYIDKVEKGNITKKGFIAQQIEEVLPNAVGKSKAFIPDIYKEATAVVVDSAAKTITVSTPVEHNLQKGDMLRFITPGGTHEKEVLSILSDNKFTVQKPEGDCSEVFVYGKKVDDFRAIDYDQVFSAGIGAIQELSRQNDELKQTIENLQNANTALKAEKDAEIQDLQQRLNSLEILMKNVLIKNDTERTAAVK